MDEAGVSLSGSGSPFSERMGIPMRTNVLCAQWLAVCLLAFGAGCAAGEGSASESPSTAEADAEADHQSAEKNPPAASTTSKNGKKRANRLARETSPYLLLHAHNPVDWYPWGPEAFEKARRENKPIFLSVGYSSCYWCHVMERLVFSNEEIARYMNEHFVNIKVDREERPDVDDIYMTSLYVFLEAVGAPPNGGWPLSMFLTPDGKPFFGGTYFPPEDGESGVGFPRVMRHVNRLWTERPDDVRRFADQLAEGVRRSMKPPVALKPAELTPDRVQAVAEALLATADEEYGGLEFNPQRPDGPKFPVPAKFALLEKLAETAEHEQAAVVVEKSLDAMAMGGIRDHLGGGFHRYSTDRRWHVPHFEKMLYDNAQLVDLFSRAYQRTKKPLYREVVEETVAFLLREMTDEKGGFHSALDAESEGVEGKFYVWSREEIEAVLGQQNGRLFAAVYGLDEPQTFEHGYVLHLTKPLETLAAEQSLSREQLQARLQPLQAKLLAVREKRPRPLKDDKILASWNGLAIRGLAQAGRILDRPEWIEAAAKAARFVLQNMRDSEGRLKRSWRVGEARLNGYLDDYAFFTAGLLALYEATEDPFWLEAARELTDKQIALFWDERGGGFFFTSHEHEEMLVRVKTGYDAVLPSGNSVSVRNLVRLAEWTNQASYLDYAQRTLAVFAPQLERMPRATTHMALALAEYLEVADSLKTSEPAERGDDEEESTERTSGQDRTVGSGDVIPVAATAEDEDKQKNAIVTARAYLDVDRLPAGRTCRLVVFLTVRKGWHINANPADPDFLIPTRVELESELGTKPARIDYPKPQRLAFPGIEKPLAVYQGEVAVRGVLQVPESAAGRTERITLKIGYQACNDRQCLPPASIKLVARIPVAAKGEAVRRINERLFRDMTDASTKK